MLRNALIPPTPAVTLWMKRSLRAPDDLQRWASQQSRQPVGLRVDLVDKIQTLRWDALQEKLGKTKRNYFRFGLSFTPDFKQPILEQGN